MTIGLNLTLLHIPLVVSKHIFTQIYTNGISYESNIFVSKSVRHFSILKLVRKLVLSKSSVAVCQNLMKINVFARWNVKG